MLGGLTVLFVVHATDRPAAPAARAALYPAHREHLGRAAEAGISLRVTGPLLPPDGGEEMVGSLLLFDAPERELAQAFVDADPFQAVWGAVDLHRFEHRHGGGLV